MSSMTYKDKKRKSVWFETWWQTLRNHMRSKKNRIFNQFEHHL